MIIDRYLLKRDESELMEIEKNLAKELDVPYVRCSYDAINSHKYQEKEEMKSRRKIVYEDNNGDLTAILDYVINYEIYEDKESYDDNRGGEDGEVYELHYLKGNGEYIVILW